MTFSPGNKKTQKKQKTQWEICICTTDCTYKS